MNTFHEDYDRFGNHLEGFVRWLVHVELAPFYLGFCVDLVRPLMLVGFSLILFHKFGLGLGIPLLFWRPRELKSGEKASYTRPNPFAQFMVGIGLGALLWQVILSGYVYEEFEGADVIDRPPFCEAHWDSSHPLFDNDFPGRFRYDPQEWGSIWRYAGTVGWGLLVTAVIFLTIVGIYRVLSGWWWRLRGWKPFQPTQLPRENPSFRVAVLRIFGL